MSCCGGVGCAAVHAARVTSGELPAVRMLTSSKRLARACWNSRLVNVAQAGGNVRDGSAGCQPAAQPVWRGCCSAAFLGHRAEKNRVGGGGGCIHIRGLSNCVHVTCCRMRVGSARARADVDVIPRKHPR